MPDSVLESEVDSVTAQELDALMKEFPDWADEFPDIQQQLQFARARQPLRELRTSPYRTIQSAHDFKPYERVTPSGGYPQSPRHTSPPRRAPDSQNGRGDFPGQYPQTERQDKLPQIFPRGMLRMSQGKFDGRTTAREHFKKWRPQPIFTFGELPSFTGSILYPGKKAIMETTTGSTFKGTPGKRSDPFHPGEGNLKIEGERHMDTTSRSTFVNFAGAQPAMKVTHNPEIIVQRRGKFNGETQSKRDFPGFSGRQPPPPRPVPPAPETIDIKFDNLRSFETEQRKQFPGIDTRLHPMVKSSKKEEEAYKLPTVQFETMTSQKMDYRPIDLTKAGHVSVADARRNAGKMPHFDPMAPPVNNFFHRHVATMKEARGTLKPVVAKTGAKLLTKKQAQFLLKELRLRKVHMAKSAMAQPGLPVNTVRVK